MIRIEMYDDEHSFEEDRFNTIGDVSAASTTIIGSLSQADQRIRDILFVVYTERIHANGEDQPLEITRLISARMATSFERGLYYGKYV